MKFTRAVLVLGAAALWAGVPGQAKAAKTLLPFAGSYTGTATSTTTAGAISANSTLTFTGRKTNLRGTFLYNGILNSENLPRNLLQTFNISKKGFLSGRITVDGIDGLGTGQAYLRGKNLTVSITYVVGPEPSTTIAINGVVTFKGKRATWTATVTSSDPAYAGTLLVTGKR